MRRSTGTRSSTTIARRIWREAIRYALLAPGKRLRPQLVLMAAEACGGAIEAALPAACAVEMVHAYSLVHDDLPAMDDDDLRRGRPTCHKSVGEAVAILVGDALLARAFEVLATEIQPPAVAAQCCAVLGRAAGASALVGGQAADLADGGSDSDSCTRRLDGTGSDSSAQDGRADSWRRWSWAESSPSATREQLAALTGVRPARSGWRFKSPTTCSMWPATRRPSASGWQGRRPRQADVSAAAGRRREPRASGQARRRSVCYDRGIRAEGRAAASPGPICVYAEELDRRVDGSSS